MPRPLKDGALAVSLINGFTPAAGNSFDILDWISLSGTFSTIQLPTLAADWALANIDVLTSPPMLPGNYNRNGVVDAADYVVWRDTLGQSGTSVAADGNGDGAIDTGDYDVWRAHFGQTAVSSSVATDPATAVPEPMSSSYLMLAAAVITAVSRWARGGPAPVRNRLRCMPQKLTGGAG